MDSSPESPVPVRSVSKMLGDWIAKLGWLWVDGQIAQISARPGAGTAFLTLRDTATDISLSITCPSALLTALSPPVAEGARVVVFCRPDFYVPRGRLSMRASDIRHVGVGELLARLERLRRVLEAEGLFAPDRKHALPFLPRCVGLVTGRGSAAEHDVLTVARRRWPEVAFEVRNVPVQGVQAVPRVVEALRSLDVAEEVDVIVLARGGGSVEDLLPFSDETLCRAVAACRTPVVSAIGHETDVPLVDHVADVRAATPTDAAKRVVPDARAEQQTVEQLRRRARLTLEARLARERRLLETIGSRPVLARPTEAIHGRGVEVSALRARALRTVQHRLAAAETDITHVLARVVALSPGATLARGYAVVQREDGHVVRSAHDVAEGDQLRLRLTDGAIPVRVSGSTDRRTVARRDGESHD